jgi:hypothetical protein
VNDTEQSSVFRVASGARDAATPIGGSDVASSGIDGFAGYRVLQRRFAAVAQRGITPPFFQPRDGRIASSSSAAISPMSP